MAKITAELLRDMVGARPGQRPLIDKLIAPLNLVLPAYGITTELRIAAFLGTCAPECDWFKTLREYGKGAGRRYGKPAGPYGLVYYGRGIFQNTWLAGYQAFTKYVAANWDSIGPRAAQFRYTVPPDFVKDPEYLATPYWAVEAACWYWKVNGLAKYADRGIKGFSGLQGLVNRGSANKVALHYPARLRAYETARRLLDDDFILAAASSDSSVVPPADDQTDTQTGSVSPGVNPLESPPTTETSSEPITLKSVGTSLWTKFLAFIAMLTGLGINTGTVIETKLSEITLNQVLFAAMGIALMVLAVFYYRKRQEAADLKDHKLIEKAADPEQNTVEMKRRGWIEWS